MPAPSDLIYEDAATGRMAERTLVAYERRDGYDLHYAHDGGDLRDVVGPDAPFGGSAERDVDAATAALRDRDVDVVDPHDGTVVDRVPMARGFAWERVVADLDCRTYDWCIRVARDWTVTAFLVLFFGLGDRGGVDRDPRGDGALLALGADERRAATAHARGWFEGVKSATADGLRAGLYDEATARAYLAGRVRSFAAEREVHVGAPSVT